MSGLLNQETIHGIFQSDILIKTGIEAAIADMRANPWVLDYMFYGLRQDPLSRKQYGEIEVNRAKQWFLNNDIKVLGSYQLSKEALPCISIDLMSSVEEVSSLGDVNAVPDESIDAVTPGIAQPAYTFGPFTPSYNSLTGHVTLPANMATLLIFSGQILIDQTLQKGYVITEVLDQQHFNIIKGLVNPNFNNTYIASNPGQNTYIQTIESCFFKETWSIGVHCYEDPFFTYYLYSILMYIFLRYKQANFEARGFERTVISAGDYKPDERFGGQTIFSRYITVSGAVKYYWPKYITQPIQGVLVYDLNINTNNQYSTPGSLLAQAKLQGWILDGDVDMFGNPVLIVPPVGSS